MTRGQDQEPSMNGTIFFRADYELIGRVLAEKQRRRTERFDFLDGVGAIVPRDLAQLPKSRHRAVPA